MLTEDSSNGIASAGVLPSGAKEIDGQIDGLPDGSSVYGRAAASGRERLE